MASLTQSLHSRSLPSIVSQPTTMPAAEAAAAAVTLQPPTKPTQIPSRSRRPIWKVSFGCTFWPVPRVRSEDGDGRSGELLLLRGSRSGAVRCRVLQSKAETSPAAWSGCRGDEATRDDDEVTDANPDGCGDRSSSSVPSNPSKVSFHRPRVT